MATGPQADAPPSFETSLAALGDIVARLESGSLGLSESIAAYEQGVGLLRLLHEELAAVEQRVSLLVRLDDEGRPVLADLDPAGRTTAAEFSQPADPARPAKRPRAQPSQPRATRLPGMDDAAGEA